MSIWWNLSPWVMVAFAKVLSTGCREHGGAVRRRPVRPTHSGADASVGAFTFMSVRANSGFAYRVFVRQLAPRCRIHNLVIKHAAVHP
eukprot:scaffold252174_cov36-Tisochrysis_lutea.AAC.1